MLALFVIEFSEIIIVLKSQRKVIIVYIEFCGRSKKFISKAKIFCMEFYEEI